MPDAAWLGSRAALSQLGLKRDYIVSAYDAGLNDRCVETAHGPERRGEIPGSYLRVIDLALDFWTINVQSRAWAANLGELNDCRAYAKPLSGS